MPDTMLLRDILDRMRQDGCGGRAGKAELFTGIAGVSSRLVRADRPARWLTRKDFAPRPRVRWPLATYPRAEGAPAIWPRIARTAVSARSTISQLGANGLPLIGASAVAVLPEHRPGLFYGHLGECQCGWGRLSGCQRHCGHAKRRQNGGKQRLRRGQPE